MWQADLALDVISQISQQFDTLYRIAFDRMPLIFPTSIICVCLWNPGDGISKPAELRWKVLCLLHTQHQGAPELLHLLTGPEQR